MVRILFAAFLISMLITVGCLPGPPEGGNASETITVYGFSIMKEALEKEIYPAFCEQWKRDHGEEVNFVSSFAGSETVVNQILQGAPADVAILAIERDADRLVDGRAASANWRNLPNEGIVNKTPFIILVRQGNPKGIHDFADLAKPDVHVIHPDPVSSGGAQWSILAIYGSELIKSEAETGTADPARALNTLQGIWKNVISSPGSAREARTQFELGQGDALITYELEGLLMKQDKKPIEIVVPKATIFSEHPVVLIDRNVTGARRPVAEAFVKYLWSDAAQRAFVRFHFRSITNESFNDENKEFAMIEQPFTVDYFGGWAKAYPEVIDAVFIKQVQKR
jgi:sulfate transport system substrate-binding protein